MKKWTIVLTGFFLTNILFGENMNVEALAIQSIKGDAYAQIESKALPEHEKCEVYKAFVDIAINPNNSNIGCAASRMINDQIALEQIVQLGHLKPSTFHELTNTACNK